MKPQDLPRSIANPLLEGLPEALKDPKNFVRVQKALINSFSACSHSEPAEMFNCVKCQVAAKERRRLMREFGFRSVAQYMAWRKVHEEIRRRDILPKYNG